MKAKALSIITMIFLLFVFCHGSASGENLTITGGGRITVELLSSDAAYHNTLSIVSPTFAIATTGCAIESTGFGGTPIMSEKLSQHGCRVELDADPNVAGIQPFPANTTFEFKFCAQEDTDYTTCEHVWSSDQTQNSDNFDHVTIDSVHNADYPGQIFRLGWEDLPEPESDKDFNDLIAVVRVNQDSDGDGLWDDWERFGIDTDGDGVEDFTLPGANYKHRDIYLEIDSMDCAVAGSDCASGDTHSHIPKNAAINEVVQAFNNAPVTNPDGINGITLHIDTDDAIPHQNTLNMGCYSGSTAGYDAIKADPTYFGPNNPRRFAYHYVLFTHQQVASSTSSGCGEVSGNDLIVSLGAWNYACQGGTDNGDFCPAALGGSSCPGGTCVAQTDHDIGTARQQSGTLMHELGHNLNLGHGGGDCTNYKPNYLSIMNYWFQFSGILPGGQLNYSDTALADLDERTINGAGQLNETDGIQDGTNDTQYVCPNWTAMTVPGTGAIDWDCDNDLGTEANVSVNINGDCVDTVTVNCGSCDAGENNKFSVLSGYDDWEHVKYDFQNTKNFEDGVHAEVDIPDMNFQTYLVTTAPIVKIMIPQPNQAVQDGITLSAQVSSVRNISQVMFSIREADNISTSIGYDDLGATYNSTSGYWEYAFDTTFLLDGYYVVWAKAVDDSGTEGLSQVVPFSIRNWAIITLLPSTPNNKAGRTMPVKFSLRIAASVDPAMPFVYNEDLAIRIYRCDNTSCSSKTLMQTSTYGTSSKNYRINGELYITNFQTTKTPAQYLVEIWRPTKNFMVGSFAFKTVKLM